MVDCKVERYFKIKDARTGKFSAGGQDPRRMKTKGKTWRTFGHLLCHLGNLTRFGLEVYQDCVVEEYEVTIKKVGEKPMREVLAIKMDRDMKKKTKINQKNQADQEARERAELQRLKEKYE